LTTMGDSLMGPLLHVLRGMPSIWLRAIRNPVDALVKRVI
jgi:hypothetical protein